MFLVTTERERENPTRPVPSAQKQEPEVSLKLPMELRSQIATVPPAPHSQVSGEHQAAPSHVVTKEGLPQAGGRTGQSHGARPRCTAMVWLAGTTDVVLGF